MEALFDYKELLAFFNAHLGRNKDLADGQDK